ncbi:MAG TPA: NUDIX domain-containing protein [Candidatus Paceibacterota bacterium]|jgi:8-oxo-dGTP pyrophosphatase MutT (NUDIX family)|nr:NUDIX domain-containing protein [Candidatus Paceibacterota bacterium]
MPHIHEKVDFTVEVFIVHGNKVLLRMHDKHHIWLSVGGHIELDENPVQAAIREVKEEVGLDIKIIGSYKPPLDDEPDYTHLIPPKYLGCHLVNDTHIHIVFVYFATSSSDVIVDSVMEHERMETRWVTKEELSIMNLRPNVLFNATEALKELGK